MPCISIQARKRIKSRSDQRRIFDYSEGVAVHQVLSDKPQDSISCRRIEHNQESESDPYKELAKIIAACEVSAHFNWDPSHTGAARFIHAIQLSGLSHITLRELLRLQGAVRDHEANKDQRGSGDTGSGPLLQPRTPTELDSSSFVPRHQVVLSGFTREVVLKEIRRAVAFTEETIQCFKERGSGRIQWDDDVCTISFD